MNQYIWQSDKWPHFSWDDSVISPVLGRVKLLQGFLKGRITSLGFNSEINTSYEMMTYDVLKSSEIEGVKLNPKMVRSSIAWHLGLDIEGLPPASHYIEGVVDVMVDAVKNYRNPITEERLFDWHSRLFPNKKSITVGQWRKSKEPMQVVSGIIGKEKVHFEAPDSEDVPRMMKELIDWANSSQNIDPIIKAAIIKLWFVTIHPFSDGNGRISRTLMDLFLTRSDDMIHRFYSMNHEISNQKNSYYTIIEKTQKGNLDITEWIIWFLECLESALKTTEQIISKVVNKNVFWEKTSDINFNARQRKILNRMLDGFEGDMTSSKYAKIAKCSRDTALVDLQELVSLGIMKPNGKGGRGAGYEMS